MHPRIVDSSTSVVRLSSHRHSYISLSVTLDLSIHNKQTILSSKKLCNKAAQHTSGGIFTFKHVAFLSQLKEGKVGSTLPKDETLRVNLNIEDIPITSPTHTHPSHSQESRLLTSSLSLGVPVPHTTECIRGV